MTPPNPIATCTLALLYMSQGHERKARQVVRSVLDADPFEGSALELARRLDIGRRASVTLEVSRDAISIAWRRAASAAGVDLHVVLVTLVTDGPAPRRAADSCRCEGASGKWTVPRPQSGGAAVACVGHVTPAGFRPLAVARAAPWSPAA